MISNYPPNPQMMYINVKPANEKYAEDVRTARQNYIISKYEKRGN